MSVWWQEWWWGVGMMAEGSVCYCRPCRHTKTLLQLVTEEWPTLITIEKQGCHCDPNCQKLINIFSMYTRTENNALYSVDLDRLKNHSALNYSQIDSDFCKAALRHFVKSTIQMNCNWIAMIWIELKDSLTPVMGGWLDGFHKFGWMDGWTVLKDIGGRDGWMDR